MVLVRPGDYPSMHRNPYLLAGIILLRVICYKAILIQQKRCTLTVRLGSNNAQANSRHHDSWRLNRRASDQQKSTVNAQSVAFYVAGSSCCCRGGMVWCLEGDRFTMARRSPCAQQYDRAAANEKASPRHRVAYRGPDASAFAVRDDVLAVR